ncbi:hypothetical protein I7X12_06140 [Halosimplex litoreum]|uniref:Uncharacterized protein n=1 Tax=Halosimplex litoreum TaxID=1198301 RepID=A0A7T3G0R9_9EURY|nr:hypothetical protein [Halosimplex litoreum]QPV64201.1 hypothetical protein I7X12_06140 [Halosimplex litoreum]
MTDHWYCLDCDRRIDPDDPSRHAAADHRLRGVPAPSRPTPTAIRRVDPGETAIRRADDGETAIQRADDGETAIQRAGSGETAIRPVRAAETRLARRPDD